MEFFSYQIAAKDFKRAGSASRAIKEHLKRIGADAEAIRRTMIAAYEAEMNVVIHSTGGRLEAHLAEAAIHVNVVDQGPGIPDIQQAMKEGFSTADAEARALGFGAGMGLPNIKRSSDRLWVTSHGDEGTRVSFTVYFEHQATRPPHFISLQASPERCEECGRCLSACPTQAVRIKEQAPSIFERLCIDCTTCIGACKPEALTIRNDISSIDDLPDPGRLLLAVPPALLADCGAKYPPHRVLGALRSLGFADVISLEPYEAMLRKATVETAAGGASLPVISPVCPAIVNLIELRFHSLIPHLAPFDSPLEAFQAQHADQPVAYVVSCPSQRSPLVAHEVAAGILPGSETTSEHLSPEVVRQAVMTRLSQDQNQKESREADNEEQILKVAPSLDAPAEFSPLVVTGVSHVIAVLEQLENGLLKDVAVIEPYACEGGCFGSPLFQEDYHVSTRRWEQAREKCVATSNIPAPVSRRLPFEPRAGIQLDADTALAIEKLSRMRSILQMLPGKNCGACGSPDCAALAEHVVLGEAKTTDCPHLAKTKEESGT